MELHKDEININKYANGELSGNALKEFEDLLEKDKALQEKVDSHKFMDAVLYKNSSIVDEDEQTELKPLLKDLGTKYFSKEGYEKTDEATATITSESEQSKSEPNRIRRLLPFAALAAAAALLLFLFIPNTEKKLYAKHFEVPDNQSKMGKILTTFDKANKAYNTKNFEDAVQLYNEYLLEDSNNPKALLYKGGAELASKQTNAAIATFQKLEQNNRYSDVANWYLALGYLKKGEEEKTESYLKLITKDDKKYYYKAQQLLKEL